jgi:predicted  nucleic acid-binding Zn-ribbon protein
MASSGKNRAKPRKSKTGGAKAADLKIPVTDEVDKLLKEFEGLDAERETLRKELVDIDEKYTKGKLKPIQRGKEYRTRLARAGQIRVRQTEIRSRLKELGRPLPPARPSAG